MLKLTDQFQNKYPNKVNSQIETLFLIPGIWVNGKDYWLQNSTEKVLFDEEMVMKVREENRHSKVRLTNIYVSNHSEKAKEIKVLAMYQTLNINPDNVMFISPTDHRIFHLLNNKMTLVNVQSSDSSDKEYTILPQWFAFTDQIWSSTSKGSLKYQPLAKGAAASIMAVKLTIQPRETRKVQTWSILGTNKNDLISMEQALIKQNQL